MCSCIIPYAHKGDDLHGALKSPVAQDDVSLHNVPYYSECIFSVRQYWKSGNDSLTYGENGGDELPRIWSGILMQIRIFKEYRSEFTKTPFPANPPQIPPHVYPTTRHQLSLLDPRLRPPEFQPWSKEAVNARTRCRNQTEVTCSRRWSSAGE